MSLIINVNNIIWKIQNQMAHQHVSWTKIRNWMSKKVNLFKKN